MSDEERSLDSAATPVYDVSPSSSDDGGSGQSSTGAQQRPDHFTDDPDLVHTHAHAPASDTNVDCMLVRILVKDIPVLCSRWLLSSLRKKSRVVDKDPVLKRSLQVTLLVICLRNDELLVCFVFCT